MPRPNDPVSYEELTLTNAVSIQAIVNVLERKGLVARGELMREVDELKRKRDEEVRKN